MAIECMKCGHIEKGMDGLHLLKECPNPNCKNRERNMFRRVPDNINEKQKAMEREWLESQEKR